jgi:hypothetical protein
MHSLALKRAVCTTFLVQCPYWPKQATNPQHYLPLFSLFLLKTQWYIHTETHQPTHFDPEDGGSKYLRNVDIRHQNMVSQPRRPSVRAY